MLATGRRYQPNFRSEAITKGIRTMAYTTISTTALVLWRALESYGCDSAALFAKAGLDPAKLRDPNQRYDDAEMYRLWQLARETTGDPCFGLVAAQFFHPTTLHALGYSWMASETLRDALNRLVRYSRMLTDKELFLLEESSQGVRLVIHNPDPACPTTDENYDALMAMIVRLCMLIYGPDLKLRQVAMARGMPGGVEAFAQIFGTSVEFAAVDNALVFDPVQLDKPLPTANAELARANDQIIMDYLAELDRSNMTLQVKARLIEQLASGQPTQDSIARELNLSARSLQRKLHEEGTTYKQLVDDTRRELAAQYVKQSRLSINEITYMLGFSEPSNFTRAFRRWTGESPSSYRLST